MARHSKDSDSRAWMIVIGQLLALSTRAASTWLILVLLSLIPGALLGGLTYLLLNDLTADSWLSAIVGSVVVLLASGTVAYAIIRVNSGHRYGLE